MKFISFFCLPVARAASLNLLKRSFILSLCWPTMKSWPLLLCWLSSSVLLQSSNGSTQVYFWTLPALNDVAVPSGSLFEFSHSYSFGSPFASPLREPKTINLTDSWCCISQNGRVRDISTCIDVIFIHTNVLEYKHMNTRNCTQMWLWISVSCSSITH